jgi:hypothetical protein
MTAMKTFGVAVMLIYVAAAAVLVPAGLYLSAAAWGARVPPFEQPADRLYLLIPGQLLALSGVLCGFLAMGVSLQQLQGWLSAVLTHGGP